MENRTDLLQLEEELQATASTQSAARTVPVESMDELIRLFGVFDENLKIIEDETGARIRTGGDSIRIEGEAASVELAATVTDKLLMTLRRGEEGLMTMLTRKNPWMADAGAIIVNDTGTNGNSPMRKSVSCNIMPTNGVIHVFDSYCYYRK